MMMKCNTKVIYVISVCVVYTFLDDGQAWQKLYKMAVCSP